MTKENTAEEWFELGKYHSNLKNARSAIESYKKCVEINPLFYQAWSNLAAEYFQLKNYEKSIEACKEALKANKNDDNAWLTLGANYFQRNEDGRALFCFDRASVLGNKKVGAFLKKAERLKDKIINAELIDVYTEMFPRPKPKESPKTDKEFDLATKPTKKSEVPDPNQKEYLKKLAGCLLEIGNALIYSTGGVVSFLELYSKLKMMYPSFEGKPEDLLKALKDLEKKNLIESLKKIENSNTLVVEFVPSDLTSDVKRIVELASQADYLTYKDIVSKTSWDEYRITRTLDLLENKGIVKKTESFREGKKWFFTSLNE